VLVIYLDRGSFVGLNFIPGYFVGTCSQYYMIMDWNDWTGIDVFGSFRGVGPYCSGGEEF
jgi:hypothetical protein